MQKNYKSYLGELVISFAGLEDSLCEGLAQILNIEYRDSKIIFSAISFRKKIQVLNALLRKHIGKNGEFAINGSTIYNLLSKANTLEAQRNMFIHSDWEFYVMPDDEGTGLKRSKLKYNRKDIAKIYVEKIGEKELTQLKKTIKELKVCANKLFEEFGQVGADIQSKSYRIED